jgi:LSD1 subclass zinc finger protein
MTNTAAPQTFNCPHCGAPLEPVKGVKSVKCTYCNNTVVVPKPLRTRPAQAAAPLPSLAAAQLPSLARRQRIGQRLVIAAAAVVVLLVVGMARGISWLVDSLDRSLGGTSSSVPTTSIQSAMATMNSMIPGADTSGYATIGLKFGAQGIGAGFFEDARSVALDRSGNILVGDFQDRRVQTFDPSGKFLSTFSVGAGTGVEALAVGPDGKIYVAHDGTVSIHDPSGKLLGSLDGVDGANALTFSPDGNLYLITSGDQVKRYDAGGNVTLTIPQAFQSVLGMGESNPSIAVDGLGNIYIVGDYNNTVLKYSPDGKYLDRFGGTAPNHGPVVPGTVFTASGITVDGYGRVFVSDWNTDIQVFDTNGAFLKSIEADTLGYDASIFGMAGNGRDTLYLALGDQIMEVKIQAPAQ